MGVETGSLASLSLTSAAVVFILWGALWVLRRMRGGAGAARDCAVLRTLALGPRERLIVVRVGARHLVLGVGSSAVSLLCELEEPLPAADGETFTEAMRKAMKPWRRA